MGPKKSLSLWQSSQESAKCQSNKGVYRGIAGFSERTHGKFPVKLEDEAGS
jgi:hypothetical protein